MHSCSWVVFEDFHNANYIYHWPNLFEKPHRHSRTQHNIAIPEGGQPVEGDSVYNYHSARLQLGFFSLNMEDAIKHGDGQRLLRCYKYLLLLTYKHKHTKYAYAILLFFVKYYALLSEKSAHLLLSNRFINAEGGVGKNIPLDLHMEHLNLVLKRMLRGVGGNITKSSLQRCAQAIDPLQRVIRGIYEDCGKSKPAGYHGRKSPQESVQIIVNDLSKGRVFDYQPHRASYPSFPHFQLNCLDVDYRDFFAWATEKITVWKGVYEGPIHNWVILLCLILIK